MKNKSISKKYDAVLKSDNEPLQPQSRKSGMLKRFLDWIAKGAEKTKTCST
ncbi:MAG: hypothetical protein GXP53_04810 [Deltaproteobacteria bacterium]|nr:hypothetical protein [Deltaproteobacteria bacterium]